MKIVNVEFNEVVKGLYISEDEKGFLVDMFDLTGLEKSADLDNLSAEVILRIQEYAKDYAEKIEGVVFDDRNYWELDLDGFVIDLGALCTILPNLKTIAFGGEGRVTTNLDSCRVISGFDFCDLAKNAYQSGNLKKAQEYFKWGKITDYYNCLWGQALWLSEQERFAEAEECYQLITGEKDKEGSANESYAALLETLGRHTEAEKYLTINYWHNAEEWQIEKTLMEDRGQLDVEKLLLIRMGSRDKSVANLAVIRLYLACVFGAFKLGDDQMGEKYITLKGQYPDFEKIKELTPKVIVEDSDFEGFLYASTEYYYYDITALETALLAMGDNHAAKTVLYFLYRDGFYNVLIDDRQVAIKAPSLKTEEKYAAFMAKNAEFVKAYALDEMKCDEVEERYEGFGEDILF